LENGKIYIYKLLMLNRTYADNVVEPDMDVPRRIRMNYLYGWDTIPTDITRLCLLYAKEMLVKDSVSKAVIAGRNEFRPEMVEIDRDEIDSILDSYRQLSMGNT
jgi:hypothetical protein